MCVLLSAHTASCPAPGTTELVVGAGDSDDVTYTDVATPGTTLQGGPGDDSLNGGVGNDALDGAYGAVANDNLNGGPGTDGCSADTGDMVVNCP